MTPSVTRTPAGLILDGNEVDVYTLTSPGGVAIQVMTLGGIVLSIDAPDRDGQPGEVTLGHAEPWEYLDNRAYFGALVGRYANRIAGASFEVDGVSFRVDANDGANHLHGGVRGLHTQVWKAEPFESGGARGLVLSCKSPRGESGFPGELTVEVTYTLTDGGEWIVDYHAKTDRPTPVNLTQHTYFNLAGCGDVLGHRLQVAADRYLPVRPDGIPGGAPANVGGTPFDLRSPQPLGPGLASEHPDIRAVSGYDHSFILNANSDTGADGPAPDAPSPEGDTESDTPSPEVAPTARPAAHLYDPASGRTLTVLTTEPAVQVYTGNHLATIRNRSGEYYREHAGVCLETQHLPDSPNRPDFPNTILRPGKPFSSQTVFVFGTDADGKELGAAPDPETD
ncbi:MAG: galactose mutarotase [Rhodothermales bacterium]|nr:galactose mutarotase [Rhodothermales bacterium]